MNGVAPLIGAFLEKVAARGGALHVSLDVDFLDPDIAPGVGTTVPGGATFREAHLVMEMLHDSGLVGSLDLVELNPFLDERGRTLSSEDFAGKLGAWRDGGASVCALVIGGPDGLDPAFRAAADLTIAFGAMTWPHQIVRALAAEQLFRALTILSGHPYHRA